ncbi:hypothetical protein D3C86_1979720 [compost metagenome]
MDVSLSGRGRPLRLTSLKPRRHRQLTTLVKQLIAHTQVTVQTDRVERAAAQAHGLAYKRAHIRAECVL